MPCADQAELLRAFDLPIALMQDAEALERITAELVETKAAEDVRYVEIRWGPLLHVARGLSLEDGIEAVVRGAERCRGADRDRRPAHRDGAAVPRPDDNVRPRRGRVPLPRPRADRLGPRRPGGRPDPLAPRTAFEAARAGGLRITVHAGEWGGAAQVRRALDVSPERIAHGAAASDDPALVAELRPAGSRLDLCPTSNVQAGIVPTLAEHALARLHRAGAPVTLSTDDTTVSDITLTEEYGRAVAEIGLTLPELWAIDRFALDVAFADEATLAPLRTAFDAWAAGIPSCRRPDLSDGRGRSAGFATLRG